MSSVVLQQTSSRDPQGHHSLHFLSFGNFHLLNLLRSEKLAADHVGCTVKLRGTTNLPMILGKRRICGTHIAGIVAHDEANVEGREVFQGLDVGETGYEILGPDVSEIQLEARTAETGQDVKFLQG